MARSAGLKQVVLTRYAKGLQAAGVSEFRVIVRPDGSHEIIAGSTEAAGIGPDPDELLK
jgi:hypothetical protein